VGGSCECWAVCCALAVVCLRMLFDRQGLIARAIRGRRQESSPIECMEIKCTQVFVSRHTRPSTTHTHTHTHTHMHAHTHARTHSHTHIIQPRVHPYPDGFSNASGLALRREGRGLYNPELPRPKGSNTGNTAPGTYGRVHGAECPRVQACAAYSSSLRAPALVHAELARKAKVAMHMFIHLYRVQLVG
jgi:hypothetical protein